MSQRHIVLLTTWFPPKQGVAVNRMVGFVKYLDAGKNRITVVTDDPTGGASSSEIIHGAKVHRITSSGFLGRATFSAGEPKLIHKLKAAWNHGMNFIGAGEDKFWVNSTIKALELLHQKDPVDVIISSYAPAGPHRVAGSFVSRHPEVKWIADMRDEMSLNPHLDTRQRKRLSKVEELVNGHATALTSVSRPILDDFRRLMPQVRYFEELRNGFDHDFSFQYSFNPVFTICYCGTFYGQRKPDTFFEGLTAFLRRSPVQISVRFVGVHRNINVPTDLESAVVFLPACSSSEAVREMASADANLLILPKVTGKGVYSGKIFEYLSVNKPVIAVVDPDDVAAGLIKEMNAGFVADFDDVNSIAVAIESAFELWKKKIPMENKREKVARLHRKYEVEKLNLLIDTITGS